MHINSVISNLMLTSTQIREMDRQRKRQRVRHGQKGEMDRQRKRQSKTWTERDGPTEKETNRD